MARTQFVWLLVYVSGKTQFVKAQTVSQIFYCNELDDIDNLISLTRMDCFNGLGLADEVYFKNAIVIPFED